MRVLIAPDKFKGSLTSHEAAKAIATGWKKKRPKDSLTLLPITDGGDGFGSAMGKLIGAKPVKVRTVDSADRPRQATWYWNDRTRTAIFETAEVNGLAQLPAGQFHPFELDTYGLGAVLQSIASKKPKKVILGIGGSATNDGGFGMAWALGWGFFDADANPILSWTHLHKLHYIRPAANHLFKEGVCWVAVDVNNPLLGAKGCTRIYGPQKGIRTKDFKKAEAALSQLAKVTRQQTGETWDKTPGAGAAGGLGFGLVAFLGATPRSGFELFAEEAGLKKILARTDLVITAEGSIDPSSLMGKGTGRLAQIALSHKVPTFALGGSVSPAIAKSKHFAWTGAMVEEASLQQCLEAPSFVLKKLAEKAASVPVDSVRQSKSKRS